MRTATFSISPSPPFRLDLTALALQRKPVNISDTWNGETYSRVLMIGDVPLLVQVTQSGAGRSPRLHIRAQGHRIPDNARTHIAKSLEALLGLRVDMRPFYRLAKADMRLGRLVSRFMGLRPPRFLSVFEGIVNGIACQQLSLHVGLTLLSRLTVRAGVPFNSPSETRHAFPRAEDISELSIPALRRLGFSTNKGIALKQLSKEIIRGHVDFEDLSQLGNEEAVERLLTVRGVGRWTAEYVLLRALGRTDVFPADDVGARNNLARWLKIQRPLDYSSVKQLLAQWHPYSGMIYFHLLLDSLCRAGSERPHVALRNQVPAWCLFPSARR
jgi:DNA-3-methyladenine glycosylase II